jgi:hypothetical protein
MTWLSIAVLAGLGLLSVWILIRANRRRLVSDAWLADHDRRSWGHGVDGVCWNWPYRGEE